MIVIIIKRCCQSLMMMYIIVVKVAVRRLMVRITGNQAEKIGKGLLPKPRSFFARVVSTAFRSTI